MTRRNISGRLELTWTGKDKALIPSIEGAYDYDWVDKNDPRACQTHYLIKEGHVGDPSDGGIHDNLLVTGESGDVLEALTRVPELAEMYVGRVKCVYIDPPFNTKKTFTHYEDNLEHSVWLTLMRDRLVLLKKLLADDGSIWIHLDDSENHRMRVLLDEVFGASSFIGEVVWKKRSNLPNDRPIAANHDSILVYGSEAAFHLRGRPVGHGGYSNPDGDPRGPWATHPVDANAKGGRNVEHLRYSIVNPVTGTEYRPAAGRNWVYAEDEMLRRIADGRVIFGRSNMSGPAKKAYLSETRAGLTWPTLWLKDDISDFAVNSAADKHIQSLFPGTAPFDTPKPEELLARILSIATNPGDLVLDCFAGSGTTAAVAHKMGRRWVTCELLPETVAKFTRPRLEKVVAGQDLGGITLKTEFEPKTTLPGDTTVEDARTTSTVLGRAVQALTEAGVKLNDSTVRALKQSVSTKKLSTMQWSGGGGFDVARLSPVWVGVEDVGGTGGAIFTTQDATGEVLARSIAAHKGFRWTGDVDARFAGRKGGQRLAVVEGLLTAAKAEELKTALEPGETILVACFGAEEGVDAALRREVRGSRVLVIPDDLFAFDPEAED